MTRRRLSRHPIALVLLGVISAYRRCVSPFLGAHCRFTPTCSAYAAVAIREHGTIRGGWLTVKRIGRCHPWHPGGVDLVPARSVGPACAVITCGTTTRGVTTDAATRDCTAHDISARAAYMPSPLGYLPATTLILGVPRC